jgi:hypothetical protein
VCVSLLAGVGCLLEFYLLVGPQSAHSLMNTEGIAGAAFVASASLGAKLQRKVPNRASGQQPDPPLALAILAILFTAFLSFRGTLQIPFVYDDYTHITEASRASWHSILGSFGPVTHPPGLFFRPVGFLLYELNYLWAGINPVRWHAISLVLHAACACLTYTLCRELSSSRFASLAGAVLFTLNGCAAEAVGWIDARFDLMAAWLALVCLLCVKRYAVSGRRIWLVAAWIVQACATLTKESAFCLPLLIACVALFPGREQGRRIAVAATWSGALSVAVWLYRWWALGGIGGYRGRDGVASVLRFHPLHTLNALLLREWAILFFPVNWSSAPGAALRIALAALPPVMLACALLARVPTRKFLAALGMVILGALPVQHLLLISPDLSGAFRVYLPAAGLAIAWSVLLDGIPRWPSATLACLLLLVYVEILEHNLADWRSTTTLAKAACTSFGQRIEGTEDPVWVEGLPASRMGVVFLANGFPQCVEMNSRVPAGRVQIRRWGQKLDRTARVFFWNDETRRLEPR